MAPAVRDSTLVFLPLPGRRTRRRSVCVREIHVPHLCHGWSRECQCLGAHPARPPLGHHFGLRHRGDHPRIRIRGRQGSSPFAYRGEDDPIILEYGDDSIIWWGDTCANKHILITFNIDPGENSDEVVGESGPTCEPIILDPPTPDESGAPSTPLGRVPQSLEPEPECLTRSNWIHTGHTIQDPPNIDLAWLRTSFNRSWKCTTTWWSEDSGDLIAYDGSGPNWWSHDPPYWAVINWRCYPLPSSCSQAKAEARAWFHCDLANCRKDFRIDNAVRTNADGSVTFQTEKNNTCFGLHSSTGYKVNQSKTDGYGGAQTTRTAVPKGLPPVRLTPNV